MEISLTKQSIQIISTISEKEKSKVFLVADSRSRLFILKELEGDKTVLYKRVRELSSAYFPEIVSIEYKDGKTRVLEEYIDGTGLDKLLETEISPETGLAYMLNMLQAISVLHKQATPLIHRDIKPENIMITKSGNVMLLDFDAMREYKSEKREQDTKMLGTRGYASPEQFGFAQTDTRSDIYSAGIVCRQIADRMNLPSFIRIRLKRVLDKATMFDPDRRFENVEQMLTSLQKVAKLEKVYRNKRKILLGICLVCLLAVGMTASWLVWKLENNANAIDTITIFNRSILPEQYEYTPLGEETLTLAEGISGQKKEMFCFHYSKAYPQALFFSDVVFEGREHAQVLLERYASDGEKIVEKVRILNQSGPELYNGSLCIETQALDSLISGRYVLTIQEDDWEWKCYLQVHDKEDQLEEYPVSVQSPVQFFSRLAQNDIFLNVLNTPYQIGRVYADDILLAKKSYSLTNDSRGVVFHAVFLKDYDEGDAVEIKLQLKNGKEVYGSIIILP